MNDYSLGLAQEAHDFIRCDRCGFDTPRGEIEFNVCDGCWSEINEEEA